MEPQILLLLRAPAAAEKSKTAARRLAGDPDASKCLFQEARGVENIEGGKIDEKPLPFRTGEVSHWC